ncbi:hypothetical protein MB46_19880 (plasmid) [Arthrobacter alpinus]|nr:hypothetical protein MB46_19880 [Arthrobacter alpinus]
MLHAPGLTAAASGDGAAVAMVAAEIPPLVKIAVAMTVAAAERAQPFFFLLGATVLAPFVELP